MATVTAECFQQSTANKNRPERESSFSGSLGFSVCSIRYLTQWLCPTKGERKREGGGEEEGEKSRCQVCLCVLCTLRFNGNTEMLQAK